MANVLTAIKNLVKNNLFTLANNSMGHNRVNNVGNALETYVKDLFANTLCCCEQEQKIQKYESIFSYLGNQNNPPDMMLKGGDAIEVKKIESRNSSLALNSSYPKEKLYSDSTMITEKCKNCEDWKEKDLLYIVGQVNKEILKELWFVYGDCYAAEKQIYERIKNKIVHGLNDIQNIDIEATNELGKIKRVDPLGITDLRIRGMWSIAHPQYVFDYITLHEKKSQFKFCCIMKKEKFESFSEDCDSIMELVDSKQFFIRDSYVKNPNNPAQLLPIKLMEYYF